MASVLVSGASGLVGERLLPLLEARGYNAARLVREYSAVSQEEGFWAPAAGALHRDRADGELHRDRADGELHRARAGGELHRARADGELHRDPAAGELDPDALEGGEAVVHLAGENIAAGRWNAVRKERIRESRVAGTKLLCSKLAEMPHPPKVLVCASAIGYYGDRGDESLPEDAPAGEGFLPDVCREWEAARSVAEPAGIRVVRLRIGVVVINAIAAPNGGRSYAVGANPVND